MTPKAIPALPESVEKALHALEVCLELPMPSRSLTVRRVIAAALLKAEGYGHHNRINCLRCRQLQEQAAALEREEKGDG